MKNKDQTDTSIGLFVIKFAHKRKKKMDREKKH